jgi:hypothetical protein
MEEKDAVIDAIRISDYLSIYDELDPVATGAEKRTVYDRAKAS